MIGDRFLKTFIWEEEGRGRPDVIAREGRRGQCDGVL